jgi:hypothetical protein
MVVKKYPGAKERLCRNESDRGNLPVKIILSEEEGLFPSLCGIIYNVVAVHAQRDESEKAFGFRGSPVVCPARVLYCRSKFLPEWKKF